MGLFTNLSQHKVQGINLIFFIGASLVAIFMNWKNKKIKFKLTKWIIILGSIGSMLGAILSHKIESKSLKKYFGIFLILIAINGMYTFISQYIKEKRAKNKSVK